MRTRRGKGKYAHPPMEIGSSTSSGWTTLRRSTDDSFWPWMVSSTSNMTPGELTTRRPRSSWIDCNPFTTTRHASSKKKELLLLFSTTTHLGPFEGINQTAFADVGKVNDADGDALRRARFVRLEETEQCRGRARRQIRTLMRTRRAEWERRSCVVEVFEPCLPGEESLPELVNQ